MVIGQKTMFIRTGGCDYSCSWCDSKFSWDGSQKATMMSAQEVYDELVRKGTVETESRGDMLSDARPMRPTRQNFNHVTISGGNPALIGTGMADLVKLLHQNNIAVGVETQGSKWQDWLEDIDDLTISPKPPSSGMLTDYVVLHSMINKLRYNTIGSFSLKVVVFNEEDYAYAKHLHLKYIDVPFFLSVGNEDVGTLSDISGQLLLQLGTLWQMVLEDPDMNSVRPLPQLHTLVWSNKRGV